MKYHVVASTGDLKEGGQMFVDLEGEEILLVQHDDEYYAIAYLCSHAEFGLEGGQLNDGCITCPYHGAEFSLKDGSVQSPPAFEPIKSYPLKVEDDTIAIAIESNS